MHHRSIRAAESAVRRVCCRRETAGSGDAPAGRRVGGTGSGKIHRENYRISGTCRHMVKCLRTVPRLAYTYRHG